MKRIFVGNLGFNAQEDEIRRLFEPHGAVESVSIATDWETSGGASSYAVSPGGIQGPLF